MKRINQPGTRPADCVLQTLRRSQAAALPQPILDAGEYMKRLLLWLLVLTSAGCMAPVTTRLDQMNAQLQTSNRLLDATHREIEAANQRLDEANARLKSTEELLKRFP